MSDADRCPATTPVDVTNETGSYGGTHRVRCVRPPGHEGLHLVVLRGERREFEAS